MKNIFDSVNITFRRIDRKASIMKITFIATGVASTIWFLIRVIPKPQRAMYPCMRAAAPIMSSFIIWALTVIGTLFAYKNAKLKYLQSKYVLSFVFGLACVFSAFLLISQYSGPLFAKTIPSASVSLSPAGTAKGIFPGRVAWVHNKNAAQWTGTGNYWDASVNPQAEYDNSFLAGIKALSGGTNDSTSWDLIFKWFNATHSRPGTGYQADDKIAIKINQNNTDNPGAGIAGSNANPQSCLACVRSLVNAGVPQADIWIGDPSRAVTDNIFTAIHSVYPEVNIVDYFGNDGRVTTSTVSGVFPNDDVVTGQSACFYNARYIVNMPLLKGHVGQGITFGSKNFYGINGILPKWQDNGNRHPNISSLTNYMTNAYFGGKTILWAMDAMYPNRNLDGLPSTKWDDAPFSGKPAASFFMSLDGVAEESVSLDFFNQHYADEINSNGGLSHAEGYLHNAADANVGVHEHWNNSTERKYSRNLDPAANGIELEYISVDSMLKPEVEITSPATNSTFTSGSDFEISGTATHSSGSITSVEIYFDNKFLGIATGTSTWSYTLTNIPSGTHTIYAVGKDTAEMNGVSKIISLYEPKTLPSKIQAEDFHEMSGIQTLDATDVGGGKYVGKVNANDYLAYWVTVPTAGLYTFSFRVASNVNTGSLEVRNEEGLALLSLTQSSTGGTQVWATVKATAELTEGTQKLQVYFTGDGLSLNWFEVTNGGFSEINDLSMAPEFPKIIVCREINMLQIEMGQTSFDEITIYSLNGEKLISKKVSGNSNIEIDTSNLAKGIYIISFKGNQLYSVKFAVH
jgi:hypothetical protein